MYGVVAVAAVAVVVYFLIDLFWVPGAVDCSGVSVPRAVIVDQLSAAHGNETLIDNVTALLSDAGFEVDCYSREAVTVDFYRNLATRCYSLILLRVHSASFNPDQPVFDLFSSEQYDQGKYRGEQWDDRLRQCAYDTDEDPYEPGDPTYFGITHKFVRSEKSMRGPFNNTIVLMMGCEGMKYEDMAEAFIERGASVYIAWDKLVTVGHTDRASQTLLEYLVGDGLAVEEAVVQTNRDVGTDRYGGTLQYYPAVSGNYTVADILSDLEFDAVGK